ncbi:hypothetical protein Tco_1128050 [Tanacetum coccineum]
MNDPNITMEEYIRLEEEKARRRGKVYNWETATYGKIWDNEDVHDLRSVETELLLIFNDNFKHLKSYGLLSLKRIHRNSIQNAFVFELLCKPREKIYRQKLVKDLQSGNLESIGVLKAQGGCSTRILTQ